MAVKGKRAKAQPKKVEADAKVMKTNEIVVACVDGENVTGRIVRFKGKQAIVELNNEEKDQCPILLNDLAFVCGGEACTNPVESRAGLCEYCQTEADRLEAEEDEPEEEPEPTHARVIPGKMGGTKTDQIGFNQYGIKWNPEKTNFRIPETEGVSFYGWVRKTKFSDDTPGYAVDIFAKQEIEFTMDSIMYTPNDPRENMRSLNADICAHCNKWMFNHMRADGAISIQALRKKAEHPTIVVRRIETIDRLILKLKEYRDTAIRCGGTRNFAINGDVEGVPVMLTIDVTQQAIALDGKPPSLMMGAMVDQAVLDKQHPKRPGEAPSRAIAPSSVPDSANVKELISRLQSTKDESERRKLRGILRKMGHRGGARKKE